MEFDQLPDTLEHLYSDENRKYCPPVVAKIAWCYCLGEVYEQVPPLASGSAQIYLATKGKETKGE